MMCTVYDCSTRLLCLDKYAHNANDTTIGFRLIRSILFIRHSLLVRKIIISISNLFCYRRLFFFFFSLFVSPKSFQSFVELSCRRFAKLSNVRLHLSHPLSHSCMRRFLAKKFRCEIISFYNRNGVAFLYFRF